VTFAEWVHPFAQGAAATVVLQLVWRRYQSWRFERMLRSPSPMVVGPPDERPRPALQLPATIEQTEGGWRAACPALEGASWVADTPDQAIAALHSLLEHRLNESGPVRFVLVAFDAAPDAGWDYSLQSDVCDAVGNADAEGA
jgi:hypothetical protein